MTEKTDNPVCTVCVHLDCHDCGYRWPNISRPWVAGAGAVACPECGHGPMKQAPAGHRAGTTRARSHQRMAQELEHGVPNGCRHCGIPQREHATQHTAGGAHGWTEPTNAQRLARMRNRRAKAGAR
jgi:hypothetical protein